MAKVQSLFIIFATLIISINLSKKNNSNVYYS